MAIRLHAVDCPACQAGVVRVNVTQDPSTGTWDYDEAPCVSCAGTGQLPAPEHYETFTLPGAKRLTWKCLWCGCSVDQLKHLPGSDDCRAAEQERLASIADNRDPWAGVA